MGSLAENTFAESGFAEAHFRRKKIYSYHT